MQVGQGMTRVGRQKIESPETGGGQYRGKPTKVDAGSRQTVSGRSKKGGNIGERLYVSRRDPVFGRTWRK